MSRYYSGPISDHFDGKRFFGPQKSGGKRLGDLLKWATSGERVKWPRWIENAAHPRPPERVHGSDIRLTMIGHVTVLIQTAGLNIVTDPVWSKFASPLPFAGPRRVRAPGIAMAELPPVDIVLVSHSHYDHLDTASLKAIVALYDPLIITPLGNDTIITKAAQSARIKAIDWDEQVTFGDMVIEAEPVNHWSARSLGDRNEALWAGFTLHANGKRCFINCDSGFAGGWWAERLIDKHGSIDCALLPIGAYAPRWFMADAHMDPDEAVRVHQMLGHPPTLGFHWGTFQLTDEAIDEPPTRLAAALRREGLDPTHFRTLDPGEGWLI
jgi:L-ascorbate metabolism protein UlaG (beta-lactamase superfamily)